MLATKRKRWLFFDEFDQSRIRHLIREVVDATTFPVNIGGRTVDPTTKGIGIPEIDGNNVHAQFFHLFDLVIFTGFDNDGLMV